MLSCYNNISPDVCFSQINYSIDICSKEQGPYFHALIEGDDLNIVVTLYLSFIFTIARNLYQLNANEVPLTYN